MKKTDWVFLVSVLLYSFLFWKQMPGLNIFIFSGLLLAGQVLLDPRMLKIQSWLLAAVGTLCASFCVFYYGNMLSILATFFSLLLSSYFAFNQKGTVLAGIFSSIVSIAGSVGFMIARLFSRNAERTQETKGHRTWKKVMIVISALIVTLIFFFMYRDSSVLFLKLTQKINFDWFSFGWVCFTFLGALIVYGFYFHKTIPGIENWDGNQPTKLDPEKAPNWTDRLMTMDSERFSGIVLLSLLNILLLFVNVLDLSFIFAGDGNLPQDVSCMQYVHQGVGTLITSIVLAMLIILFYFRGRMNFAENGKALRVLALIWIVQNAFMLFSTAWRNEVYVLVFGLTYKRIGVYVYLVLTLIGLIVTAWKVQGKKTNAFMIRMNSWLFYSVWVLACFVNWDGLIIKNNLSTRLKPDLDYLNSLSSTILPELVDYSTKHPAKTSSAQLTLVIPKRVYLFLNEQTQLRADNKWPSYILKANHNYTDLMQRPTFGKSKRLAISNSDIQTIYYYKGFENIVALEAANNDLLTIGDAAKFQNLQVLDLSFNPRITSIAGLENTSNLEYINLYDTGVRDFSPLLKLKNLKRIICNGMSIAWQNKLQAANLQLVVTTQYQSE